MTCTSINKRVRASPPCLASRHPPHLGPALQAGSTFLAPPRTVSRAQRSRLFAREVESELCNSYCAIPWGHVVKLLDKTKLEFASFRFRSMSWATAKLLTCFSSRHSIGALGQSARLVRPASRYNQRRRNVLGGRMKLTNEELDALLAKAGLRLDQEYSPRCSYRKAE